MNPPVLTKSDSSYDELINAALTSRPTVLLTPLPINWYSDNEMVHRTDQISIKDKELLSFYPCFCINYGFLKSYGLPNTLVNLSMTKLLSWFS